jgi:hypothetical protein
VRAKVVDRRDSDILLVLERSLETILAVQNPLSRHCSGYMLGMIEEVLSQAVVQLSAWVMKKRTFERTSYGLIYV